MRLRVIDFGYVPALRSQAVFHGLAMAFQDGDDPILSLVNPEQPYVCVGMFQEVGLEVDEEYCRAHGLMIIRRRIGGGAVYLDRNQMFTHFIYPHDKAPSMARNIYPMFIEPVVRTYRDLGIQAEYRPVNDIQVAGRKIGGTGAASIEEAMVVAGSFMFDFDTANMARCLKVPSEKFRDKLKTTLDDYMTTMAKELDEPPSRDRVKALFMDHCARWLGVEVVEEPPNELEIAAIEQQEKALGDPNWTYRQGRKFVDMGVKIAADTHLTESAHKAPGGLIRVHLLEREGKVADLMLSGDFTCIPAEGVDEIATRLAGCELSPDALEGAAARAMEEVGADMPGIAASDLVEAILAAVHKG